MKIWISGEVDGDIGEDFRVASLDVEDRIKYAISRKDYDIPLKSLDCIAIIRDDSQFSEIKKYSRAKKEIDFRLAIPYADFSAGSGIQKRVLIFQMVQRSVEILKEKIPNCPDLDRLLDDISAVAVDQGWLVS